MSVRPILLMRQSGAQNYGFTIEHVATYPPRSPTNSFVDEADPMMSQAVKDAAQFAPIHTILVSRVDSDGIAARNGIRVGDRVVAIEGVPVLHLSHKQAQEMVHNSGHRLSLMIVSSRRPSSRPPSLEDGRGACRRLFCDEAEGRNGIMPHIHQTQTLDSAPLRQSRLIGHSDPIYDDTDSSSIPTVPSLSSVTSSGSNGYGNGNGGGDYYEAMLREKRRELNSSPRVRCYNYPNQDSRIRALFDEMRPKIEDSGVCGSTAASVTSFSSSPSPPQEPHRYGHVKPRIKLAEPDSWMRHNHQQSQTLESAWKRAPFVQNQWNKRHGAGDWSGRFEDFQQHNQEAESKPFDYRTSKRQASFMAAINGRGSLQNIRDEVTPSVTPDSSVLSPPFVVLSSCTSLPAPTKPPIPFPGSSTVAGTKITLRSKKANNQRANDVDRETPSAPLRRRPRNDPRRKTIHDFAQALEAEQQQQQHKKGRNMLDSGVVSDGESSTAKSRVPSATTTSAVNSSPSHNPQPISKTTRQRPVSYMMATGSPTRTGMGGFDAAPLSASQSSIPTASHTHHRRALASFASSNLSPADAAAKFATSAASSPSAHGSKINKFIAFFSNHEPSQHKSLDLSTASERREVLKRAATTGTATISSTGSPQGQKLIRPVKQRDVQYQGQVFHKEVRLGESSKRTAARRWDQCFAVLHRHRLYLCKQLSSSQATDDDPLNKILNIPGDAKVLEVKAAIVDIAYEVLQSEQRHNVVRIMTQEEQHVEHFLQTESEVAMLTWIEKIRSVADSSDRAEGSAEESHQPHAVVSTTNSADSESSLPSDRAGSSSSNTGGDPRSSTTTIENAASANSTGPASTLESACTSSVHGGANSVNSSEATSQLIMHRYKAKTNQLGSPHSTKKSVDESLDGLLGGPSTSSDGNNLATLSSPGDTITPKSGRRWKKSKAAKQGSGSSGRSDKTSSADKSGQSQPTAAFGKKISECTVSGEEGDLVPLLVQICIRVVEAHGMDTVGIYRIPGNTAAVNALKEALTQGFHSVAFQSDARWRDVNVVSSLLKMFLRNLPEPLLTDKLYPFFIDANRIASHHNRLHKIRNLLRKLPDEHYATLKFLMGHFRSVVSHSAVNKMEVRNMALMFGPSIVRPSDDTMATLVTHMSDQCRLIESFINYFDWMFDDNGTAEQSVPEQIAGEQQNASTVAVSQLNGSGSVGVVLDTGPMTVSSFNDMHNLLRKVNEQEAVALMNENKSNKITKILNVRRNSRKDKSKSKKMPTSSTSSIGHDPPSTSPAAKQSRSQTASVDSAFCGHYQERDIDAEIACRQTVVPLAGAAPQTSASSPATTSRPMTSSSLDKSPSVGSSLGSYEQQSQSSLLEQPASSDVSEMRRRRLQNLYSARRIFIAGTDADDESVAHHADPDDLASHSRHLNAAGTPALDVLSQESREKIQRIQKLQSWSKTASTGGPSMQQMDSTTSMSIPQITKGMSELTVDDAVSLTSDYSTTSSAAPMHVPMSVSCHMDQLAAASSDYASSDVSPAPRGDVVSPTGSIGSRLTSPEDVSTPSAVPRQRSPSPALAPAGRIGAKLRFRNNRGRKDPLRRHTLSDMDTVREALAKDRAARSAATAEQTTAATTDSIQTAARLNHTSTSKVGKFARWIKNSFRKSSPDLRIKPTTEATDFVFLSGSPRSSIHRSNLPPLVVSATEPNNCSSSDRENRHLHELTPVSTDEQL